MLQINGKKIDNSSVLDGIGTGQKVTKWEWLWHSNTLTDGPITFSSNDSTFAGNITLGDSHFIGDDSFDNLLLQSSSGENLILSAANDLIFYTGGSSPTSYGTQRLRIFNSDGSATFAGNLNVNGNATLGDATTDDHVFNGQVTQITADALGYKLYRTGGGTSMLISAAGDAEIEFGTDNGSGTNTTHWTIGKDNTDNSFRISNSASLGTSDTLTLVGANATFAGTINLSSNKGVVWPGGSIRAEGNTLKLVATTLIDLQQNTQVQGTLTTTGNATFAGDVNITQTTDVGVLNTTNLDNGSAVGLSLTYPTSNVAAGDGLAIAIGITGRGRSYIANSNITTNLDASNLAFYTESGGVIGERMIINQDGNVGIGTDSPDSKLDVTGGDITVNTSGVGFMNFKYGSVGSEATMGSIQTTGIDLKINATSDLLLLPGSNVGIGVTGPTAKLHVSGNTKLTGGTFEVSTDASVGGAGGFSYSFRDAVGINNPNSVSAPSVSGYVMSVGRSTSSGVGGGIYVEGESRFVRGLAGAVKFNAYGGTSQTGTPTYLLGTDASGNVVKTNSAPSPITSQAASLYDLIPNGAFTTTYAFTSTAGTYAKVMQGDDVITANGTYTVQMFVNDYAVGGTQYSETYSGIMSWGSSTNTNDTGGGSISEIVLHRSGHAANQGMTYLRTRETTSSEGNELRT